MIERHYQEEEEQNKVYKKRLIFLLPFNMLVVAATARYCQNIHKISKRFWSHRQKATFRNVLYVGTIQALCFTTMYCSGTLLILGMNPRTVYQRHIKQKNEELTMMAK